MKKLSTLAILLFAVLFSFGPRPAFADDTILGQIYAGFVGNAKLAIESTTGGLTRPEFLVNYIEIGSLDGKPLLAVDAGVGGTLLPGSQNFRGAAWNAGGKIHLAPVLRRYAHLPTSFEFLGTLEIDARGSYDFTEHHPYFGLVAAYPFK